MLELVALARTFRINLILYTEGRRSPEYVPATGTPTTFADHPTGVIGFQDNHFVWYRYDWRAATGGDLGAMTMANALPSRRGAGARGGRRTRTGRDRVRMRRGLGRKERNRLVHALTGNPTTNLDRAYAVARQLNTNKMPRPHQAAAAIGAEEPRTKAKPPEGWVTKMLPMVVIAEIGDVQKAPKVNLRGDIVGIVAHLGTRIGTFYGVQSGRSGDAVYDNWVETLKNTRRISNVRFRKFGSEREARTYAGLPNRDFVRVDVKVHSSLKGEPKMTTIDIATHIWERDVMKRWSSRPDGTALEVVMFGVQKAPEGDHLPFMVAGAPLIDDAVLPTGGWRSALGEGADRRMGVSLYAGAGGLEVVHGDVGVPNAVACDNDRAVIKNRKEGRRVIEMNLTHLCDWHKILEALDDFADRRGWDDWGSIRMHSGLPCQPWTKAFKTPPGLADVRGWHFVQMLRLMAWLQPAGVLLETGEAIMGTHAAVWWLIVLLADLNGFPGRGQITDAVEVAAQARRRAYAEFWRRDVWEAACRANVDMVRAVLERPLARTRTRLTAATAIGAIDDEEFARVEWCDDEIEVLDCPDYFPSGRCRTGRVIDITEVAPPVMGSYGKVWTHVEGLQEYVPEKQIVCVGNSGSDEAAMTMGHGERDRKGPGTSGHHCGRDRARCCLLHAG